MQVAIPRVSVIVPVYKDWDALRVTLEALKRQTLPEVAYEVIVADNGPQALADAPKGVRYCHEPRGYSYTARNAGAAIARGEVLAFTDADCSPAPDWLAQGLAALDATQADVLGGKIAISPAPTTLAGKFFAAFSLRQEDIFRTHKALATANLFARRKAFDKVNGFDARFQSGGDWDFCRRVTAAGGVLVFSEAAVVRHTPCKSLGKLFKRNRRIAGGKVDMHFRFADVPQKPDARFWWNTLRPDWRGWLAMLRGQDARVQGPLSERFGIVSISIGLRYHGALSTARALLEPVRDKDVH